jgi:4-amino-4-deoxy-L-arabinose transferase-like glycosyltransferase
MFLRHDLVTPTLGGHLWFEKPALLYWMMIASFKLFGVSEWSARLGPAISGLLTITAVWWIGRRVERAGAEGELSGLGFWSVLAAGTTSGILIFSRAASFDIVVTMTIAWALGFFLGAELEENVQRQRRLLIGFYVFVGVSLLAKGLVGIVVPFGVVSSYYLLRTRAPQRSVVLSFLWGMPLAMLVAATWYAPIIWRHGWLFVDQFFIQHHFARYLTDKYHHPAPVYYYLLVLVPLSLPWSVFVIEGLLKTVSRLRRRDDSLRTDPVNKFKVFAAAWILLPLVFFSLSGSKLPGYILPIFPAAALLAGESLSRLRAGNNRWVIRVSAGLWFVIAAAAFVVGGSLGGLSFGCIALIAAPLIAAGVFGLLWARRGSAFALFTAGATLTTVVVIHSCGLELAKRESSKQLLRLADARGYSQSIVYGLQRSDRSPEFYAAGRVAYDPDGEATKYEGVGQVVWESRRRGATVLAFVPVEEVGQFNQLTDVRVDVVGNNGKYALVAVGAPQ